LSDAKRLADIRRDYVGEPLSATESDPDPLRQFSRWFDEARVSEADPTAMALATASADGRPLVRVVLLKGYDARGFSFFTNYDSQKAHDIDATGRACLLFYWGSLNRQVQISGRVERVSAEESDAYFATRPLESRWSVYASHQSAVVDSREALETRYDEARQRFGNDVPRPGWWGGYRVIAEEFQFWQGRPSRLHDRVRYTPDGTGWRRDRLAP
jgi:pyridoxamine 5'-phosphate oxidase